MLRRYQHEPGEQETSIPSGPGGDVMRERHGLQVETLISDIREFLMYQGADDALIERVDDNRVMITLPEW